MELQYLRPIKGEDLEGMIRDDSHSRIAKYINKHYVFVDRANFPKKPDKNANRATWEAHENECKRVSKLKEEHKKYRDSGKFLLFRDTCYVLGLDSDTYFVLSGNAEKDEVDVNMLKSSTFPRKYAGRRLIGDHDSILVPFCGGMYRVNIITGESARIL